MLTEDESRHLSDGTEEAVRALEMALLLLVAHGLLSGDPRELIEGAGVASAELLIGISSAAGKARDGILDAASNDLHRAAVKNATSEDVAGLMDRETRAWAKSEAGKIAQEAMDDVRLSLSQMVDGMAQSARQGYGEALRYARRIANRYGHEKAMEMAVTEMARNGITAYSYTRKDGTVVRVPADVAVRREITRAGKDRYDAQQDDIAKRLGANYYDVSFCPDARESHAQWQGKRYQIQGSGKYPNFATACHVGDPVDGYGGYNCHHTRAIVKNPDEKFKFRDTLKGTGYTNEQVRELTAKQRRLENDIRKQKRAKAALEADGRDVSGINRAIRDDQAQLRQLIGDNSKVLRRQPWRERLY